MRRVFDCYSAHGSVSVSLNVVDYEDGVARSQSWDRLLDMIDELGPLMHIKVGPEWDGRSFYFVFNCETPSKKVIQAWVQRQSQTGYRVWLEEV